MSDVELVIKIPREQYSLIMQSHRDGAARFVDKEAMMYAIKNGMPLPKGHWINAKVGRLFPSNDFKCSECRNILDFNGVNCGRGDANYCPNCGARMVEP